jgi:hypothetical protein
VGAERARDDVTDAWRARAAQWLQFARTPGHDLFFDQLNLPWFAELLPAAGRRTLVVGCGKGPTGAVSGVQRTRCLRD